jgi:hypothetical protein
MELGRRGFLQLLAGLTAGAVTLDSVTEPIVDVETEQAIQLGQGDTDDLRGFGFEVLRHLRGHLSPYLPLDVVPESNLSEVVPYQFAVDVSERSKCSASDVARLLSKRIAMEGVRPKRCGKLCLPAGMDVILVTDPSSGLSIRIIRDYWFGGSLEGFVLTRVDMLLG